MWVQSLGREDRLQEVWQPTPVFLPRESHGQRSLEGSMGSMVHGVEKSWTRLSNLAHTHHVPQEVMD